MAADWIQSEGRGTGLNVVIIARSPIDPDNPSLLPCSIIFFLFFFSLSLFFFYFPPELLPLIRPRLHGTQIMTRRSKPTDTPSGFAAPSCVSPHVRKYRVYYAWSNSVYSCVSRSCPPSLFFSVRGGVYGPRSLACKCATTRLPLRRSREQRGYAFNRPASFERRFVQFWIPVELWEDQSKKLELERVRSSCKDIIGWFY